MSRLEKFIRGMPRNDEIAFEHIARHGGRDPKLQVKYIKRGGFYEVTSRYAYTGYTIDECLKKLERKLANPQCHVNCPCHGRSRL
jgi:hypothetical protein